MLNNGLRKFLFFSLLIFFLFNLIAWSEQVAAENPVPILPAVPPLKIFETQFSNGLKLLTSEDHSAPIITFQLWYQVGSRNETFGKTGLSHILEHLSLRRSKNLAPEELARIIQKNGGRTNAFTSHDVTCYHTTIGSSKLELLAKLYSDIMSNFILLPEDFYPEMEVIKEERRMRVENDPFGDLIEQMRATSYMAHSYQWPILGWMSDLNRMTLDDVQEYHKNYYLPNNVIIVLVGDFQTQTAVTLLRSYFENIPAGDKPPMVRTEEPVQNGKRLIFLHKPVQTTTLVAGFHMPEIGHPDEYILHLISEILANGESARLYRNLVYENQIALQTGGFVELKKDPGLFWIYAVLKPNLSADEGQEALFTQLEQLKEEFVTNEELQRAKNQLQAEFIYELESYLSKGMQIGYYSSLASANYLNTYLDKINAITKEDIRRVAQKYFSENNCTLAIQLPERVSDNSETSEF